MSATGRGTTRDPRDNYATPRPAFAPLLGILPRDKALQFWEPACGDRRLITMLYESGRVAGGTDLEADGVDFLTDETQREFIITNPPFTLAFEFCKHGVKVAPEVLFLLRLNFLASRTRAAWFKENEPGALFVLSDRPGFVMSCTCKVCRHNWILPIESVRPLTCEACGSKALSISTTDSCDYAWFYWGWRYHGIRHL